MHPFIFQYPKGDWHIGDKITLDQSTNKSRLYLDRVFNCTTIEEINIQVPI